MTWAISAVEKTNLFARPQMLLAPAHSGVRPAKAQYYSFNDFDRFAEISSGWGSAAAETPGVVADFPLHATRIVAIAAGGAFFVEDFPQHAVMKIAFALRGE